MVNFSNILQNNWCIYFQFSQYVPVIYFETSLKNVNANLKLSLIKINRFFYKHNCHSRALFNAPYVIFQKKIYKLNCSHHNKTNKHALT